MPRRREVPKREIIPDPKYHSQLVAKFVNCILRRGKKSTAERVLYKSFDIVSEKTQSDPLKVLKKALENVKPALEVKSRRVGGSTYQVPIEVKPERRQALAIRWILEFAKERTEQSMEQRLAGEILDAANSRGNAVKKKENTHKMAEANKAFAHYRW
jgi:small subunit ribosomal protein S7